MENDFQRKSIKFTHDHENDPDIAEKFDAWSSSYRDSTVASAPTPQAAKLFKQKHENIAVRAWAGALATGDNNLRARTAASVDTAVKQTVSAFTSGEISAEQTFMSFNSVLDTTIAAQEKTPEFKKKLENTFIQDAVIGVASKDPQLALDMLESRRDIDPTLKASLMGTIQQSEKTINGKEQARFEEGHRSSVSNALRDGIPLQQYPDAFLNLLYGENSKTAELFKMDVEHANKTIEVTKPLTGANFARQQEAVMKAAEGGKLPVEVQRNLEQWLSVQKKMQDDAPADWLRSGNDDVASAWENADLYGTPEDIGYAVWVTQKYQGYPPKGVTPEEAAKYLNRNPLAWNAVPESQAAAMAKDINTTGTGSERMAKMDQMSAKFKDAKQFAQVWGQMAQLPEGQRVDPEIRFAMAIPIRTDREQVLGVLSSQTDIAAITELDSGKFNALIEKDQAWKDFSSVLDPNIGPQRSEEVKGLKRLINSYAKRVFALGNGRESIDSSVKKAMDKIVGSIAIPMKMANDAPFMVAREREGGKPLRTPEDVMAIKRALDRDIANFPVQTLARYNDDGLPYFPKAEALKGDAWIAHVQQRIKEGARPFNSDDSQSALIYFKDEETGAVFALVDQNRNPYQTKDYDQLIPPVTVTARIPAYGPFGGSAIDVEVATPPSDPITKQVKDPFSMSRWALEIGKHGAKDAGVNPLSGQKLVEPSLDGLFYPLARWWTDAYSKEVRTMPGVSSNWKNLTPKPKVVEGDFPFYDPEIEQFQRDVKDTLGTVGRAAKSVGRAGLETLDTILKNDAASGKTEKRNEPKLIKNPLTENIFDYSK